eukprot:403336424
MLKILSTLDSVNFEPLEINIYSSLDQIKQLIQDKFKVPTHFDFDLFCEDFTLIVNPMRDLFQVQGHSNSNPSTLTTSHIKIALLNQKLSSQTQITQHALNAFPVGLQNLTEMCGKYFKFFDYLTRHPTSQSDGNGEKIVDLLIDKVITRRYVCPISSCRKTFDQAIEIFSHTKTHVKNKDFQCFDCGKYYQSKMHLQNHQKVHSDKKQFKCDYPGCTKGYSIMQRLQIHKRTHNGLKPFVCPYKSCLKRFNEKGNLKTHIRSHTGLRPYVCNVSGCDSAFITQGHLNDHMKRHSKMIPLSENGLQTAKIQQQNISQQNYSANSDKLFDKNCIGISSNYESIFNVNRTVCQIYEKQQGSPNQAFLFHQGNLQIKEAQMHLKNELWRKLVEKETGYMPESS